MQTRHPKAIFRKTLLQLLLLSAFDLSANAHAQEAIEDSLWIRVNISNCQNCNTGIADISRLLENRPDVRYKYLLPLRYRGKGSQLLTEYIKIPIDEPQVEYDDNKIAKIEEELGYSSGVLIETPLFEIMLLPDHAKRFLPKYLQDSEPIVIRSYPARVGFQTDNLFLHIIEGDTFIIDRNLWKVTCNGIPVQRLPQYAWDLPGFFPEEQLPKDSANLLFRLEYTNLLNIKGQKWLIGNGNKILISAKGGEARPTPFAIQLSRQNGDWAYNSSLPISILSDTKKCYLDDYAIFYEKSDACVIYECGTNQLNPTIAPFIVKNGTLQTGSSKKIKLNHEQEKAAGYILHDTEGTFSFVGLTGLYKLTSDARLAFLGDFYEESIKDEFPIAFSKDFSGSDATYILFEKKGNVILRKEIPQLNSSNKSVQSYAYTLSIKPTPTLSLTSNINITHNTGLIFNYLTSDGSLISIKP